MNFPVIDSPPTPRLPGSQIKGTRLPRTSVVGKIPISSCRTAINFSSAPKSQVQNDPIEILAAMDVHGRYLRRQARWRAFIEERFSGGEAENLTSEEAFPISP